MAPLCPSLGTNTPAQASRASIEPTRTSQEGALRFSNGTSSPMRWSWASGMTNANVRNAVDLGSPIEAAS